MNNNNSNINISDLTFKLKNEDQRNNKIAQRFKILYFTFGILYALVFIFHYIFDEENTWMDSLSGLSYVMAWLSFALLFRKANKDYSHIDYSLPTITMLQKAAKRYKLFQPRQIPAIGAALLVDIASCLNKLVIPLTQESINDILIFQLIFFPALIIGFAAGVLIWYKRHKPIRDNALALIKELES
nr:hypothetical protein [uncultured Carboxylicivirga sp.]